LTFKESYYIIVNGKVPKQINQVKQMQARMNRTDTAELTALVTGWMKKKRGLVPKGYKLIFWVGAEKLESTATIEVRVMDRGNGKASSLAKPTSARKRRPRNKE